MNRRSLLSAAVAGVGASLPLSTHAHSSARDLVGVPNRGKPVKPPAHGPVQVAFLVGPQTVLIDVAGPWEALNDAMVAVNTYTVGPSMHNVELGGLTVRPDYTYDNAPQPHVIVVPAMKTVPGTLAWIKKASKHADITMSICTGAFVLAKTGLLDGQYATTHHGGYDEFEREFPKVKLVRGPRYVENYSVSTSGGETSGIDLGLRVLERYFGTTVANTSATNMEHVRTKRPA